MQFAEIVFQQKTGPLVYQIPKDLKVRVGQSVKVQLRNRFTTGLVWKIHSSRPSFKTLRIKEINIDKPLLSEKQIELIDWMEKYYFCPVHKILKLFIPKRVFENKPVRVKLTDAAKIIKTKAKNLTAEQQSAISAISANRVNKFLIHGITGSGKTEIYTRLAEEELKAGRQVLILVPEISLTPQIINYFEKSLGIAATVIHSKISEGERYTAWQAIWKNEAKLIIGSRSAIFSPLQKLGLIIIDEEHELSYKQENAPRYTVHKIAEKILGLRPQTTLVLGSATPSIETAEKLKDSTIQLKERIGESVLPEIEIVDLREEFKKQNYSIFSESLREELGKILEKKEQAILFLNRRGSASSVVCRDCGYIEKCTDCELPMTYHAKTLSSPGLICHHCGKIGREPSVCPNCKGVHIRYLGIGTQKIESELRKEFPSARVLRADKDTTGQKHSFKKIYEAFLNHEADILIGTQMIAKGLHLPKVNLVGVILADIGLNIPDFRSAERNFQLMTQVAGRSGRDSKGKVIIQTYNPENLALACTQNHDYQQFFNYERTQRKILRNPPFGRLAKITVTNRSLKKCREETERLERILKAAAQASAQAAAAQSTGQAADQAHASDCQISSYPAYITRLRGSYYYIILIKTQNDPHNLLEKLPKEDIMNANIKIDIDPISIT